MKAATPPAEIVPEPQDIADLYFPSADGRWSVKTCAGVLGGMILALVGAIALVLRSRDLR
jgi:hypothetical protein